MKLRKKERKKERKKQSGDSSTFSLSGVGSFGGFCGCKQWPKCTYPTSACWEGFLCPVSVFHLYARCRRWSTPLPQSTPPHQNQTHAPTPWVPIPQTSFSPHSTHIWVIFFSFQPERYSKLPKDLKRQAACFSAVVGQLFWKALCCIKLATYLSTYTSRHALKASGNEFEPLSVI